MGITRQAGEELSDLRLTHLCRVTVAVKGNKALDPSDLGLLSSLAIVPGADRLAHPVKELGVRRHRLKDLRFVWWLPRAEVLRKQDGP